MAWQTATYKLTSSAPLIQHNGQTADPLNAWAKRLKQLTSKRLKTDADYEEIAHVEFLAALYLDPGGPVIPSDIIDALVISAAKKSKEGLIAKSACFCGKHAHLEYEGPRDPEKLWAAESFRFSALVRVGNARVVRMRPIFREWSALVELTYEPSLINLARVDEWMHVAGAQIGLCEWRPKYGRFEAVRVK